MSDAIITERRKLVPTGPGGSFEARPSVTLTGSRKDLLELRRTIDRALESGEASMPSFADIGELRVVVAAPLVP
jgi:hypothetical protein